MQRTFDEITDEMRRLVDLHAGAVPISVLEQEMMAPRARVYEAIGWLIREGSLTLDAERGIVYACRGNTRSGQTRRVD